jgi:hypothetical protein
MTDGFLFLENQDICKMGTWRAISLAFFKPAKNLVNSHAVPSERQLNLIH